MHIIFLVNLSATTCDFIVCCFFFPEYHNFCPFLGAELVFQSHLLLLFQILNYYLKMLSFPVMKTFHLILMYLLPILLFVLLLFRVFHILLLYENMFCFTSNILALLTAYLLPILCFCVILSSFFLHNLSIVSLPFF